MAEEGFEAYHVPQQSRRDKIRVVAAAVAHNNQPTTFIPPCASSSSLLPLYDPSSLISSDFLTSATQQQGLTSEPNSLSNCVVKEEHRSSLMMGFGVGVGRIMNGSSSSSSPSSNSSSVSHHRHHHHQHNHHAYNLDPESSSLPLNPAGSSIHVFGNNNNNNNPFLYQAQNIREFDPSYSASAGGSEIMVFKPEPLSLSLSSHNNSNNNSSNVPLELNLQRFGSVISGGVDGCVIPRFVGGVNSNSVSGSNEASRSSVPLGPFTGYASVLKGSRFLKPAQQLLEELCDVGGVCGDADKAIVADASLMEPPPSECLMNNNHHHEDPSSLVGDHGGGADQGRKKSRLFTMLDEVYRRYRQYYQQMHAVVTSFEYVSGLSNAAPFASLAIKTMSKHFRCLKNAITDQLKFANKTNFHLSNRKDEFPRFRSSDRGPYSQRFIEHQPVWRPQRGLPERAVTVLRAWLFEHFLHPYPSDTDKLMLAKQTGLSRSQVSNWFINARVRLWKPMVEEIHTLETRQAQKSSQREDQCRNKSSDHLPSDYSLVSENPPTSADNFQDATYKHAMDDLPTGIPIRSQEQVNLPCAGIQLGGVGASMGRASNVSLTLGLHQNHHGIGLAETFPLSSAQRFGLGLETNNEGYVLSGFDLQNRHFDRDVIGGQLLHDFVG